MSSHTPRGGERTTARFDPDIDAWVLSESPVGPGGAVDVALAGDVILRMDAADPGRVVDVTVEAPVAEPAVAAVAALFGAEPATVLVDADPAHARPRFDLEVDPATRAQRLRAGRLALLDDLARQHPASPWWSAEAALLCAQADVRLGLSDRAGREARAGAEAILGLEERDRERPVLGTRVITQAGDVIASCLTGEDPDLAARIRSIVAGLGDPSRGVIPSISDQDVHLRFTEMFPMGTIDADLVDATRAPLRVEPAVDPDVIRGAFALGTALADSGELVPGVVSLPGTGRITWNRGWKQRVLSVADGVQWTFEPAEMLVQVPIETAVSPEELDRVWVRVFDRASGDLIAIAPLHAERGLPRWAIARVAVPRSLSVAAMAVGVTNWPATRPDGTYTHAVRTAADKVRRAGGAERLGGWRTARQHWEGVAAAWQSIGDPDRRAYALCRAAIAARKGGEAQAAEDLAAALRAFATGCKWVHPLLHDDRDADDPFLAEQFNPSFWLT